MIFQLIYAEFICQHYHQIMFSTATNNDLNESPIENDEMDGRLRCEIMPYGSESQHHHCNEQDTSKKAR